MPGIVGIIYKSDGHAQGASSRDLMVQSIIHENFYVSGAYSNAALRLHVGWSGLKGTFSDCMPVWNEAKDICLIFWGEHFADPSENESLKSNGHQFDSANASALVHLYEEIGLAFLERLNGWFSGLLVDLREGKIILFNDRYGFNRICFHENSEGFYFASEAKALLKVLPDLRQIDYCSLGEFFSCGCVLQNKTLFQGIATLPGGSAWTFLYNQPVRKGIFFKRESWEQLPQLGAQEYYEKLRETWFRILPRYFHGKERIGFSLTGGLDSRMILACAACPSGTLPCYTFGGPYRDCADVLISRQVAKICQQSHETIQLGAEYFKSFPTLVERAIYLTDGTLDATGSADLFVQKKSREIGPVRITGVNGGELLRRLVMFKPWSPAPRLLAPEFARQVQDGAATYVDEKNGNVLSFIMFKQAPWHLYGRLALERSQITIRTPYSDNDLVALAYQAPPELRNSEPALRLIAEGNAALKNLGTDRATLLKSIPGITQAQHMFQEFTFKAEYAYDYGMPQWLAKLDHALSPFHLEKLFLGRHKFYHFRIWFREQFAAYLKDILLDPRALNRPYVDGRFLEKIINDHTTGRANYTLEIQRVLTAELLQRQLIEQNRVQ
jgi:asparagine synthase (glutamine-hydrolysing)